MKRWAALIFLCMLAGLTVNGLITWGCIYFGRPLHIHYVDTTVRSLGDDSARQQAVSDVDTSKPKVHILQYDAPGASVAVGLYQPVLTMQWPPFGHQQAGLGVNPNNPMILVDSRHSDALQDACRSQSFVSDMRGWPLPCVHRVAPYPFSTGGNVRATTWSIGVDNFARRRMVKIPESIQGGTTRIMLAGWIANSLIFAAVILALFVLLRVHHLFARRPGRNLLIYALLAVVMSFGMSWLLAWKVSWPGSAMPGFLVNLNINQSPLIGTKTGQYTNWNLGAHEGAGLVAFYCEWSDPDVNSPTRIRYSVAPPDTPTWAKQLIPPSVPRTRNSRHMLSYLATGWPMPGMWTMQHDMVPMKINAISQWQGSQPDFTKRQRTTVAGLAANRDGRTVMPLGIVWHGFIINACLYAIACLLLVTLVLVATRWRSVLRERRGRCRKCSYDLTGAQHDVCPECGTVATPGSPPLQSPLSSTDTPE